MKTKKSLIVIEVVTIAAIAAGTGIGMSLTADKQPPLQISQIIFLSDADHASTVFLKKEDVINITSPRYGDGEYIWMIV